MQMLVALSAVLMLAVSADTLPQFGGYGRGVRGVSADMQGYQRDRFELPLPQRKWPGFALADQPGRMSGQVAPGSGKHWMPPMTSVFGKDFGPGAGFGNKPQDGEMQQGGMKTMY